MWNKVALEILLIVTVTIVDRPGFASSMVVFDFDLFQSHSRKGTPAADVEAYMEQLFGSDVSVSQNTSGINSSLKVGKGRGAPGITIDFGDNPIDSFSVDYQLFKGAKNFKILADGVVINQQTLSRAQRKAGLAGHQNAFFFDVPVQTLQFVGINKKSFAIDNLVINIPSDEGSEILDGSGFVSATNESPNLENTFPETTVQDELTPVPEPSSLLMLIMGVSSAWLWTKRLARA